MTKEQREAYRPALEAWLDGELEFAKDGKNFERWDSGYPPVYNYPPDHYRRRPKPRVCYIRCIGTSPHAVEVVSTQPLTQVHGQTVYRCEEVLE